MRFIFMTLKFPKTPFSDKNYDFWLHKTTFKIQV